MTDEFENRLAEELTQFSVKLEKNQIDQFYKYFKLLVEWNKVMNLTAITEQNQVITKHFVDSLAIMKVVSDIGEKPYRIVDLGTGAGFPGIPLKIAFPQLTVTLMDSLNKRVKFLNEVTNSLNLHGIQAVHGRAEDLGRNSEYRETFDFCASRAVANLSTLSEYCLPFVKPGGSFISYKSVQVMKEVTNAKHAIFLLGGKVDQVEHFALSGTDAERYLIRIQKVSNTSKKYPRKAGIPGKEPLG